MVISAPKSPVQPADLSIPRQLAFGLHIIGKAGSDTAFRSI